MISPAQNETNIEALQATSILNISFQVVLFCIGLLAQIKIVLVCYADKNKTWKIHIFHAIATTLIFATRIIFKAVMDISPYVCIIIGSWIGHIYNFVSLYGFIAISCHTLVIAIMKFVFCVHAMKARAFGESRIENIFLWINILFPLILCMEVLLTNKSLSYNHVYVNKCVDRELWTNSTVDNTPSIHKLLKYPFENNLEVPKVALLIQIALRILLAAGIIISGSNLIEGVLYYKIFKAMKRQVTPAPHNRAANSLSKFSQTRNIRSVEVNSRVAMILWIIECVANINLYVMTALQVDNVTKFCIAILCYHIILPYTFLINTSDNKDRIAENGWRAVIFNPFVQAHSYFFKYNTVELAPELGQEIEENNENTKTEKNKTIQSSGLHSVSKSFPHVKENTKENKENVFILSNKIRDKSKMKVDSDLELEDLEAFPSTSKNKNNDTLSTSSQPQMKIIHTKSSSSDLEPEIYTKSIRLKIGETILRNMVEQTKTPYNENAYLHYFYQLLEFENLSKNGTLDQRSDFEILPFKNFDQRTVSKIKCSISQADQSNKIQIQKQSENNRNSKTDRDFQISVSNDNTFNLEIRNQLRCDTLKHYEMYCEDENLYDIFLNMLIEAEEELKDSVNKSYLSK